jgi:uncharacterized repeat protein (TIGR01451 family)
VPGGANLQDLNLPIDPNGIVYNSVTRAPIAGAVVRLLDASSGSELPTSCFDDPAQQNQVTLAGGFYKFDLNFNDAACPSGGDYVIAVTAPGSDYMTGYSQMIPPLAGPADPSFSVPTCPASASDAIGATAQYCEAQPSEYAPATSVPGRSAGTNYYVHLLLDRSQLPGSSQIFNNHLPLDPTFDGAIGISKTTPMLNVTRGQLVPYVITLTNQLGGVLPDVMIVDRYPAGFTYVEGSARLDDVPVEPTVVGRELRWNGVTMTNARQRKLLLLLAVGAGVTEGEYVNRAQALNGLTQNAMSGEATATGADRARPDFRLHRRHRQGVRRRQSQQAPGRRRERSRRRARGHDARAHGDHRRLRPLPHYVRRYARRGSRQQLCAQARRSHAAERVSPLHRADRRAARDTR